MERLASPHKQPPVEMVEEIQDTPPPNRTSTQGMHIRAPLLLSPLPSLLGTVSGIKLPVLNSQVVTPKHFRRNTTSMVAVSIARYTHRGRD